MRRSILSDYMEDLHNWKPKENREYNPFDYVDKHGRSSSV